MGDIRVWPASRIGPQLFVGTRPSVELFQPPLMTLPHAPLKPHGGLWTSSLRPDGTSAWVEWCRAEDFGGVDGWEWWRLEPEAEALLLVVDGVEDLDALVRRFPHVPWELSHRSVLTERFTAIDAERVAGEGYSGIHLTERGQRETRYSKPYNLYGWDVESTLWLRWTFVGELVRLYEGRHEEVRS